MIHHGHIYEINEIRGPYKCENAFFQKEVRFYLTEKKRVDTVIIESNNIYIFHDGTVYFNTSSYLAEIETAYAIMLNSNLDKNSKEKLAIVFEELHAMSSTSVIRCQKLMYYVESLRKFNLTNKTEVSLEI